jgi:ABC-type branched-subunit amino acid transport system ATPase component
MLEIKNLHVSIGERKILDGLNLTVHDGEVAAIMGPNGTGKSTLSYVVSGREGYEVTQGEVLLNGENILGLAPHERGQGRVFGLSISGRNSRRRDDDVSEGRAQRAAARAWRGRIADSRLHEARQRGGGAARRR